MVTAIEHRYDLVSPDHEPATELVLNDIGRVHLRLGTPIVADVYAHHAEGGRLILIDAAEGITAQDAHVAGYVLEQGRAHAVNAPAATAGAQTPFGVHPVDEKVFTHESNRL